MWRAKRICAWLVVLAVAAALPAGAAGSLQARTYVKNCRGVPPTLPVGSPSMMTGLLSS